MLTSKQQRLSCSTTGTLFTGLSGRQYYLPNDVHSLLINDLEKHIVPMGYKTLHDAWCAKLQEMHAYGISDHRISHIRDYLDKLSNINLVAHYGRALMISLIGAPIVDIDRHICAYEPNISNITLSDSLASLINVATSDVGGSRGAMVGRGEACIPLLFLSGEWNHGNDAHDVTIAGQYWHVKWVETLSGKAPLGRHTYSNSCLGLQLRELGMSSSELAFDSQTDANSFMKNFNSIRMLPQFKYIDDDLTVVRAFQAQLDDEMRELGVGSAAGVIFATDNILRFVKRDECYCGAASQAAHKISMEPDFFTNNYSNYIVTKEKRFLNESAIYACSQIADNVLLYREMIEAGITVDKILEQFNANTSVQHSEFVRYVTKEFNGRRPIISLISLQKKVAARAIARTRTKCRKKK
jgi:hypothetical protein